MTEFTFQATLLASIRVTAETQAKAELKPRAALEASEANLGMLDGAPIVVPVEIEGELDPGLRRDACSDCGSEHRIRSSMTQTKQPEAASDAFVNLLAAVFKSLSPGAENPSP